MHRLEATILDRKVTEVVFSPTYQGGPLFILAKFHDQREPSGGELILGFASKDVDEALRRVERFGGRVRDSSAGLAGGPRTAFIEDGEGHLIQISQAS